MRFPQVASLLLIGLGAVQAGDAAKDKEKLKGSWDGVEQTRDGQFRVLKEGAWTITFAGDKVTLGGGSVGGKKEFRVKLDPAKKPKAIDLTALDGPFKDKVVLAIYQLEGDTLKLCFTENAKEGVSKERPKEFASKVDSGVNLFILKRSTP